MSIASGETVDVQRDSSVVGDRAKELRRHLRCEFADLLDANRQRAHAQTSSADVECAEHQRLVHWYIRMSEPSNPGAVTKRVLERLAQRDPHVLDSVVVVDVKVAGR